MDNLKENSVPTRVVVSASDRVSTAPDTQGVRDMQDRARKFHTFGITR